MTRQKSGEQAYESRPVTAIPEHPPLRHLVSLEEIDRWLVTYKELIKSVEGGALHSVSAVVARLEEHRRQRRAELA
jgi:hypothetical protein